MRPARIAGLVLAATSVISAILLGSPLGAFIDIPSALVMGLPVAGGLWAAHGTGWFEALRAGARSGATREQRAVARAIVRTARRLTWLAGAAGVLIGVTQMLNQLDDPAAIGPALAVALLTLTYAAFFDLLVLTPLRGHLEHQQSGAPSPVDG